MIPNLIMSYLYSPTEMNSCQDLSFVIFDNQNLEHFHSFLVLDGVLRVSKPQTKGKLSTDFQTRV
jgi:hypothetical protein